MHRIRNTIRSAAVAATLFVAAPAAAAPFLSVDYNSGTSPTESGFTGVTAANGSSISSTFTVPDVTSGAVTVVIGDLSGDNNRDRGAPPDLNAFTFGDLYRDNVFDNGDDDLTVTFSGLNASTAYDFKFYAYNETTNTAGQVFTFTSGSATGSVAPTARPTSNDEYSTTLRVTTDAAGTAVFTEVGSGGTNPFAVLNGFTVSVVPEPGALGLLGMAAAAGLRRRRRGA